MEEETKKEGVVKQLPPKKQGRVFLFSVAIWERK
jgi:hypothetical protein